MGISNILALRGDCLTGEKRFSLSLEVTTTPTNSWGRYAVSRRRTAVRAFSESESEAIRRSVSEAANIDRHENLKRKVNAGASKRQPDVSTTRSSINSWTDVQGGRNLRPDHPGLKPISTPKQVRLLPESFSIDIPFELTSEISARTRTTDRRSIK